MNRQEIKDNLVHGDKAKIARKYNTSTRYVHLIIDDENRGQRGMGKKILEELESVAISNIKFFSQKN